MIPGNYFKPCVQHEDMWGSSMFVFNMSHLQLCQPVSLLHNKVRGQNANLRTKCTKLREEFGENNKCAEVINYMSYQRVIDTAVGFKTKPCKIWLLRYSPTNAAIFTYDNFRSVFFFFGGFCGGNSEARGHDSICWMQRVMWRFRHRFVHFIIIIWTPSG